MPAEALRQPWWLQFRVLMRLQFSEYKDSAAFLALFSLVMPLGLMWLLGGAVTGPGSESGWFLAGNLVMTVGFGSFNFAVGRMGQLRINKEMDYYASLPVSRSAFVLTLLVLAQLSVLPGMVVSMVVGHLLLAISWSSIAVAFPVALLCAVCLTVVGTALGGLARTWGQVSLYGNLIYFVVLFLSPTMRPFERLALPLKVTSVLLPTGQGAIALTEALAGRFGERFWLYAGLLCLWTLAATTLGLRRLDWRND